MGLAAGQARLLTITGRKSDCEYQSMKLSHQKIALARELADLSNEYQNSLDQTKLIYDYYGKGDTSTQLSYGILMNPSALNDYMPITVTDSMGRITLNSKYANVARKAGIPQEGLGTLPSENIRKKFIQGLVGEGLITEDLGTRINDVPYNQKAGFGGGVTVATTTASGNINKFIGAITSSTAAFDCSGTKSKYKVNRNNAKGKGDTSWINIIKGSDCSYSILSSSTVTQMSLADLLSSESKKQYYIGYRGIRGEQTPVYGIALMQQFLTDTNGFIDWLSKEFSSLLDLGDNYSKLALDYATRQTQQLIKPTDKAGYNELYNKWLSSNDGKDTDERTDHKEGNVNNFVDPVSNQIYGKSDKDEEYQPDVVSKSKDYIGFTSVNSGKGGGDDGNDHATGGINLNNIAKAFLTYFADYMNGLSKTNETGAQVFEVKKGSVSENQLCDKNKTFQYTWKTGTSVSSDDMAQATFYDTLFNQICANGWTENNQIEDKTYLQQMLQSGMLYLSKAKDDGYYYQENYATDSYIKEIEDDTKVAQAEAKYTTEKAKLNAKEETLDLKMKNLDTEISSLSTEYDTVKNAISKNIEKSFKRYNA